MAYANATRRRVREKHRLTRQKAKAKKRGIDTSDPFWRLLLSKANVEAANAPAPTVRPGRGVAR